MPLTPIQQGVWLLRDGSNIGFIVVQGQAVIVDAGLDKDAGRKALRALDELEAQPVGIIITHAHADHFGGAAFLARRTGAPVYAPSFEATVVENPIWEPLYLYGGAAPPRELRHKFILAQPCPVSQCIEAGPLTIGDIAVEVIPLPGHAWNQVGVAYRDTLFCADAFFPPEILNKHGVPFCVDIDAALETLHRLSGLDYAHFVPGHGDVYEDISEVTSLNQTRLEEIRSLIAAALTEPQDTATLVQRVAEHYGVNISTLPQYYLTRTTVLAALTSLQAAGMVTAHVTQGCPQWVSNA